MMYLALTYDHRLLDGREAVTFLVKVIFRICILQCSLTGYAGQGIYRGPETHAVGLKVPIIGVQASRLVDYHEIDIFGVIITLLEK